MRQDDAEEEEITSIDENRDGYLLNVSLHLILSVLQFHFLKKGLPMASPMSDYSSDAKDFINDYSKNTRKDSHLEEHQDIIKEFGERYERAYQMLNTFYAEAYKSQSFYLGNQWSLEELAYLNNQRRNSFTYNQIKRVINLVEGIQRSNRLATVYSPIEDSADETAELLTDVGQYVMQYGGGYEKLSTGFKDACITGISWISPYIDYRDDPVNGDIKFHLDQWNACIWDPFFYERDLSDMGFFARRKYLARNEVMSLVPDKETVINALPYGSRDDKFTYMPFARQWGMQKLLNYTEYWRAKWIMKDVLVDMKSGETSEWKGDRRRLAMIQQFDPSIKVIRKPVRTVELGIIVEGELIYYGQDPYGLNDYPFVPIWVAYEPSYDLFTWKLQGLVQFIRDPQVELNKRLSKMTDLLDSQLQSGWIAKTGAVTNTSSLFKSGSGQVLFVRPDANIDTDVRRIEPPSIPDSNFALMSEFEKNITTILGINPEMLGMPENQNIETAAILAKMRTNAGLIGLRNVFDSLGESQKILGHKVMQLIQRNYSPEKVQRITKKQPTDEFYSQNWGKYNVVVEEGLLTDTQRHSQYMQLMALKQTGVNIPDGLIIKNSNLHNKAELNEILDAQAKQSEEVSAKQEQLQMHQMKVMTDGIESKAHSDLALAQERLATINLKNAENAERIQRAEQDKTAADLNFIKALKELQEMDLNGLAQKIQMLKELSSIQHADGEQARLQREHEMAMQQQQSNQQIQEQLAQ